MRNFRNNVSYDPAMDIYNSKEGKKKLAAFKNAPAWKKELWLSKAHASQKRNRAPAIKTIENLRLKRENAEQDAAKTIVMAVSAMQHALMELQYVPAPHSYNKCLNPQAVHNAIFLLRNKCGVAFPPDEEFSRKIELDTGRQSPLQGDKP
jgi:hypothetical protein